MSASNGKNALVAFLIEFNKARMHLKVFFWGGGGLHQKVLVIFKYPFFHLITFLTPFFAAAHLSVMSEDFLDITTPILFNKV